SGRHVCPTCHAQLPVGFGRIRSRTIALVGAREVGKTVFMTVLVHELMNRVGARFDASVGGADDHTRHRFSVEHEARLYNDRAEEHTSELQSRFELVCRLLLEKKKE